MRVRTWEALGAAASGLFLAVPVSTAITSGTAQATICAPLDYTAQHPEPPGVPNPPIN